MNSNVHTSELHLLPATGAGTDPTLFIVILVIATLAIAAGLFLLRRRPPS